MERAEALLESEPVSEFGRRVGGGGLGRRLARRFLSVAEVDHVKVATCPVGTQGGEPFLSELHKGHEYARIRVSQSAGLRL